MSLMPSHQNGKSSTIWIRKVAIISFIAIRISVKVIIRFVVVESRVTTAIEHDLGETELLSIRVLL